MQKYHPILYSTAMVCAILEGRKTQTRRIIKPQPTDDWMQNTRQFSPDGNMFDHRGKQVFWLEKPNFIWDGKTKADSEIKPRFGAPGDILWVREKWCRNTAGIGYPYHFYAANDTFTYPDREKWKPGIHMPRAATRLWTINKGTRVQRLQDISEADAIAEGIDRYDGYSGDDVLWKNYINPDNPVDCPIVSYQTLWEVINGAGSWEANPLVWAVTNPQYDMPIDEWMNFKDGLPWEPVAAKPSI